MHDQCSRYIIYIVCHGGLFAFSLSLSLSGLEGAQQLLRDAFESASVFRHDESKSTELCLDRRLMLHAVCVCVCVVLQTSPCYPERHQAIVSLECIVCDVTDYKIICVYMAHFVGYLSPARACSL